MLKRWTGFTRFLADGRVCLTNNAAERALRGLALGRKAWLFAGSDRGADRAAFGRENAERVASIADVASIKSRRLASVRQARELPGIGC